jgi:hypothetical protein
VSDFTAQEIRDRILQSLRENSASFRQKKKEKDQSLNETVDTELRDKKADLEANH